MSALFQMFTARFLSCVISLIVLLTLPSPSSAVLLNGPFTLAIFCSDLNRQSKLLVIPRRFELPVVYTGDLKSPRNRA